MPLVIPARTARALQARVKVAADGGTLFPASNDAGWVSECRRFGAVTEMPLPAQSKERLKLSLR